MKSSRAESAMARFILKYGPFGVEKGRISDKPEITNYKHQITNKFQITICKPVGGGSNAVCLGF
jgi:hypothetical protein